MLKPVNFDIETVLGFVLGTCMRCYKHKLILYSINILKQILRYIINYIHSMPCYFVSNGVEMSMTNQTFDFIWNSFGNKELTDSETSSSSEEGVKQIHLAQKLDMLNWKSRTTDTTTKNQTTKSISKDITKRKRNNRAYAIFVVLT